MEMTSDKDLESFENLLSIKIEDCMQDWDILCADGSRIEELCDIYESDSLTPKEKNDVMRLIVASFDEGLREEKATIAMWERISHLLKRDYSLHKEVIEYWSLLDREEDEEDEDNVFPVTPLMRKILQNG